MTLAERVAAALDPGGPLASGMPDFEARASQRDLAERIASAFEHGGTLIAEAGTGIGKTIAYLLPALLVDQRVLISTGTRTLQDQVFHKDLPALQSALGLTVSAACMKGRANYLCRHRFDRLREAGASLPAGDQRWLHEIALWSAESSTGDRAEIEDLPDDFALWPELSATAEQCLGRDCPRYDDCFVTRMKERAAAARIVIVNHHLLCADASVREGGFGEVIPDADIAVIDEAHQLEDVLTIYFGVSIGTHRLDELAREASLTLGAALAGDTRLAIALASLLSDAQQAWRGLFDAVREEIRRAGASERITIGPDMQERLAAAAIAAREALDRLAAAIDSGDDAPADVRAIATRAGAAAADVRLVLESDDPAFVRYAETRGRGVLLRASPIDVGGIIRSHLVGSRRSTVLTSATLAVEGQFAYVKTRLGLEDADTVQFASEFDFRTQARLYLPADLPDPRSPEFNRAAAWIIGELLDRSSGRAFVLFTSYNAMREVHGLLARRVGWPLLLQGTSPRSALLRDFRHTPNAVLLATASFWQGVDVAGPALSCVIVDRLPFASPADPLVAARIKAVGERGGHAFHDYQVPQATLTLLQGLGRLIRSKRDRGVLAVLDPRLTRMGYGRRFLASLPAAPITADLSEVQAFFAASAGSVRFQQGQEASP